MERGHNVSVPCPPRPKQNWDGTRSAGPIPRPGRSPPRPREGQGLPEATQSRADSALLLGPPVARLPGSGLPSPSRGCWVGDSARETWEGKEAGGAAPSLASGVLRPPRLPTPWLCPPCGHRWLPGLARPPPVGPHMCVGSTGTCGSRGPPLAGPASPPTPRGRPRRACQGGGRRPWLGCWRSQEFAPNVNSELF